MTPRRNPRRGPGFAVHMALRPVSLPVLAALALAAFSASAQAASGPAAATGPASDLTPTSVTLEETVTPNGESTQAGFDYGTSAAYGTSTPTQGAGAGTAPVTLRLTVTGLTPGTTYHFRAVAANASGTAAGQDATFTTPTPPPVPAKPSTTTNAASAVSLTQATLSSSTDPNGQATRVSFDYGTSTAYGQATATQDAGSGTTAVTLKTTVKGLAENTTYHFRSRAVNASGTTLGADRTFTTSKPPAPGVSTGSATDVLPTTATLVGSVDANGRATIAYAEFGTSTAYGSRTPDAPVGSGASAVAFRAPVTGLAPLTTYHFRIVAVGPGGTVRGHDRTFTTPSAATVVSLVALPNPVRYGSATHITGRLQGSGAPGAPVSLVAIAYPFTTAGTTVAGPLPAGADGSFAFSVRPRIRTRYLVRATAAGQGVTAPPLGVRVTARVSLKATSVSAGRVRLTGHVGPVGSTRVQLRRVTETRTTTVATTTSPTGAFSFTVKRPRTAGGYSVRAVPSVRGVSAGVSSVRRVARRR